MALKLSWTKWKKKKFSSDNNTPPELVETDSELMYVYSNPWNIKKKINHEDLNQKNLLISYFETFEYILPYWMLDVAKELVNGNVANVRLCDVTNDPKMYEKGSYTFRKLPNHVDYSLSIVELFTVHKLEVGDEIALFWNPIYEAFIFKLLSKIWRKKKFSYNFISSKPEEEEEVNSTPQVELIETGPAVKIHPNYIIRHLRKKITRENIAFGELRFSFLETSVCILPFWKLELARTLVNGKVVRVNLWNLLEQNVFNKYEGGSFTFRKLRNDDYSLSCKTLINDCGLSVGDEIGIYWYPMVSKFIFKVISKVRDSIRPV